MPGWIATGRRELRFLRWDALIRFELRGDRAVEQVRERCPDLPRLDRVDDASFGIAPSLLIGLVLIAGLPLAVAVRSFDLRSIALAAMVGTFAFKRLDGRLLPRLDARHRRSWSERTSPLTARVMAGAARISRLAGRFAGVALATAAALAVVGWSLTALHGPASPTQAALALGIVAALIAVLLAIAMLVALLAETLAPTLLGPAEQPAHVVSRAEFATLEPLLETRPIRLVRDAWDLLRALRP